MQGIQGGEDGGYEHNKSDGLGVLKLPAHWLLSFSRLSAISGDFGGFVVFVWFDLCFVLSVIML